MSMTFDFTNVYAYEWADIWYADLDTEIGIKALRILIANQEDSFKLVAKNFKDMVANNPTLKSIQDEEERAHFQSQFFDHEEMAIDQVKRLQRYGMCTSIFSFLEARLRSLCQSIEQEFKFRIKERDLAGREDVTRYKHYFEKVFAADLTQCDPFYTPITQQKYVRNIITHQDGRFNADEKKNIVSTNGLSYRQIGDYYEIEIMDIVYLNTLLDNIEKYMEELLRSLDKRYIELKKNQSKP